MVFNKSFGAVTRNVKIIFIPHRFTHTSTTLTLEQKQAFYNSMYFLAYQIFEQPQTRQEFIRKMNAFMIYPINNTYYDFKLNHFLCTWLLKDFNPKRFEIFYQMKKQNMLSPKVELWSSSIDERVPMTFSQELYILSQFSNQTQIAKVFLLPHDISKTLTEFNNPFVSNFLRQQQGFSRQTNFDAIYSLKEIGLNESNRMVSGTLEKHRHHLFSIDVKSGVIDYYTGQHRLMHLFVHKDQQIASTITPNFDPYAYTKSLQLYHYGLKLSQIPDLIRADQKIVISDFNEIENSCLTLDKKITNLINIQKKMLDLQVKLSYENIYYTGPKFALTQTQPNQIPLINIPKLNVSLYPEIPFNLQSLNPAQKKEIIGAIYPELNFNLKTRIKLHVDKPIWKLPEFVDEDSFL